MQARFFTLLIIALFQGLAAYTPPPILSIGLQNLTSSALRINLASKVREPKGYVVKAAYFLLRPGQRILLKNFDIEHLLEEATIIFAHPSLEEERALGLRLLSAYVKEDVTDYPTIAIKEHRIIPPLPPSVAQDEPLLPEERVPEELPSSQKTPLFTRKRR